MTEAERELLLLLTNAVATLFDRSQSQALLYPGGLRTAFAIREELVAKAEEVKQEFGASNR